MSDILDSDISLASAAWRNYANCIDMNPDIFFPERGGSTSEAREVCAGCAVVDSCLEYALMNNEYVGIWGGTSERERRKIRNARS